MGKIEIDEGELNATREAASQMIPWRSEAHRLADALYRENPDHPLLRSEIWRERMEAKDNADPDDGGISPENDVVEAAVRGDLPRDFE